MVENAMSTEHIIDPGIVLQTWRIKVLNGFLVVAAVAAAAGTVMTVLGAISSPGQWPSIALYSALTLILALLAIFRRIDSRLRTWGLLLVAYFTGVTALATLGLGGSGRLYLISLPVIALILLGVRSGVFMSVLSVLTLTVFAILAGTGETLRFLVSERNSLRLADWLSESSDTLMILSVIMLLLILFYRFQEQLIDEERRTQTDLRRAQALLEEQNATLELKVQERTAELLKSNKIQTALFKITNAASISRDMPEFYANIHQIIGELMYAGNIFIALYDETSGLLSFPYFVDEQDEPFPTQPLENFHGMTSYVIRTGESIPHGWDKFQQLIEQHDVEVAGTLNEDGIGVPLKADGKIIGAIFVQSYTQGIHYSAQDDEILAFVAQHIATSLTRLRALEAERQRTRELAILNSISEAMVKTLDLKTLMRLVGDKMREIFDADSTLIMLLDRHTNLINVPYEFDRNEGGYIDYVEPFPLGTGLSSKVITTGQPLMLGSLEQELANGAYFPPEIIEKGSGFFSQSWLGVPVIAKEQVLGLVALADARAHAFDENHLHLLQTLSANMGMAIENARLFDQAREARVAAEQASQAKSAFLANMSHELRTPLNAIIGFTRIIRRKTEGQIAEKQTENLDKVLSSAEHLLSLINTVLDIAKIEAGRMDVLAANFRIASLVDLCYNTAQPLLRPSVILEKQIDESLGTLYSDQDKIRQIVLNLLSNAAKFTHTGSIILAASHDGDNLRLAVSDTGIGISAEALPRIFKEFQQADNTTTRQYGGTGLGLSISRNLAHLLGGDLTVESEPGKGSTFTLVIPLQFGSKPAPQTPEHEPAPLPKAAPHAAPDPAKKRLLVIDDDPDAVYLLQENLNQQEFEIQGARNGADGLRKAREQQPQAILLDIVMPGADGWQVLHDLKEDPHTAHIPVILLTIVDKKALGFQLGASAYLLKPLDPLAVREALQRLIPRDNRQQKHLLVVDDDPGIADMLRQFLPESEYKLASALDGVAGLAAIAASRPDVLLLDIIMPRLDGFAVIEALRADPQTRDLPIIVISAKDLTSAEAARLKETVAVVMQKQGFQGEKLIQEIESVLKDLPIYGEK